MGSPPKVFVAHRTADKPIAEPLARALRTSGIDAWFDKWEIRGGDNFVAKMEEGIRAAHGGLLLCTATGFDGSWTYEEYAALLRKVVEERGKPRPFLIPVLAGDRPVVPEFLRTRLGRKHTEVDEIVLDILAAMGHEVPGKPPLGPLPR